MKLRALSLSASLVVVGAAGCNCDDVLSAVPAPFAVLTFERQETPPLDFLEVTLAPSPINGSVSVELGLRNDGAVDLQVADVALVSDPALCPVASAAFSVTDPPAGARAFVVAKESSRPLTIAFTAPNAAVACAVVEVTSDDPVHPVLRAVIRGQGDGPQLCTDRAVINFGEVFIGDSVADVAAVRSCGTRAIRVDAVSLNEQFPDPFGASLPSVPVDLAPGALLEVPVTFTPLVEGSWSIAASTSGQINVDTEGGQLYRIDLVGSSRRPPACRIQVIPSVVQFGSVGAGRTSTQPVIVRNIGELDCTFTSADVVEPAGNFSRTLTTLSAGQTLAPLAVGQLDVTFAPGAVAGVENGILRVTTSDPVQPVIDVPLEGTSVEITPCFLEPTPTAVGFGSVQLRHTSERTVRMTNIGTERCIVLAVDVTSGAPEVSVIEPPLTAVGNALPPPFDQLFDFGAVVPVGGFVDIIIGLRPETPGPKSGLVHFTYKEVGFGTDDQFADVPVTGDAAAPCIVVTPTDIDFGAVATGAQEDAQFAVRNCGAVDLSIRGIQMRAASHAGFSLPVVPALPATLAPGFELTVTTRAAPTAANIASHGAAMFGFVDVMSDADEVPVALRANTTGFCQGLVCAPSEVHFGDVVVGDTLLRTVTCTNPSSSSVAVAPSVNAPFVVVSAPDTIAPGGSGVITLSFAPATEGQATGELAVGADACDGSPIVVDVDGTGSNADLPPCPTPTAFQPSVTWEWAGGSSETGSRQVWASALVSRLEDTDGDGAVTRSDMPRVIFPSFDTQDAPELIDGIAPGGSGQINDPTPGVLRAVSGDTGAEVWTVSNPEHRVHSMVTPALADIDGDGTVEIIAQKYILLEGIEEIPGGPKVYGKYARGFLIAFNFDGSFRWVSDEWTRSPYELEDGGGVAVGDMDGDGLAEIATGDNLYDHNGRLLFRGGRSIGGAGHGPVSVIADVDGQPGLELVCGTTVYRKDGSIVWDRSEELYDGLPAVGDLDGDGDNEVVVQGLYTVVLDGATGATLAGPIVAPTRSHHETECEPPDQQTEEEDPCNPIATNPALMDIDGDGDLEITIARTEVMVVFNRDLSVVWKKPINDHSGASGPAGFDFENDGTVNCVYADEGNIWSWTETGQTVYDATRFSVTIFEYATIADIDNDGHANMLIGSNDPFLDVAEGLDAWENSGTQWAHARAMWNQHAFVEGLITELGTMVPNGGAIGGYRTTSPQCVQ